jgi:hypothetical protein
MQEIVIGDKIPTGNIRIVNFLSIGREINRFELPIVY